MAYVAASLYGHNTKVTELKQEAINQWHIGYQQGWEDARKPIEIDTIYYVDTVIVDLFLFENIEDNINLHSKRWGKYNLLFGVKSQ